MNLLGRITSETQRWQFDVVSIGYPGLVETLPSSTRCGGNEDAIEGGLRLWREIVEPHDKQPSPFWRVVQ